MKPTDCKLQMLDLYFSKFSFTQERGKDNTEYSSSFNIEYSVDEHSALRKAKPEHGTEKLGRYPFEPNGEVAPASIQICPTKH